GSEGAVALDLHPVPAGGDADGAPALPVGPRVHGPGDVGDGAQAVLGQVGDRLAHAVLELGGDGIQACHAPVHHDDGDALRQVVEHRVGLPGAREHDPVDDVDGTLEARALARLVFDGV